MSIEAKAIGKITHVLPLQSGIGKQSGKEWRKQTYVLQTEEQYPVQLAFDVWGDRINEWGITLGDVVAVEVEISSQEFNERWYTGAKAYKAERVAGTQLAQPPTAQPAPYVGQQAVMSAPPAQPTRADDLPF